MKRPGIFLLFKRQKLTDRDFNYNGKDLLDPRFWLFFCFQFIAPNFALNGKNYIRDHMRHTQYRHFFVDLCYFRKIFCFKKSCNFHLQNRFTNCILLHCNQFWQPYFAKICVSNIIKLFAINVI